MSRKRWFAVLLPLAAILAYRRMGSGKVHEFVENFHTFSMPDAGLYDAVIGRVMQGFYVSVATEMAVACSSGTALEVGSGPGRLAVAMGVAAPRLTVTGLDVAPDMVDMANRRAGAAGVGDRVRFQVGDVGAMPFADDQFDLVVSTFSMHHWPDPARGLAEIQRVLKPGGTGCIYDISGWIQRVFHEGNSLPLAAATEVLETVRIEPVWGVGPMRLVQRVCWTR